LLLTLVSGLLAIRSIVWFALASGLPKRRIQARAALGVAGIALAVVVVAVTLARPSGSYESRWPVAALGVVSRVTESDRSLRVLADDRYADWLLWEDPGLVGRVAYDVRFELFSEDEFSRLYAYRNRMGDDWRRARDGYRLHAFHPTASGWGERSALAEGEVLYRDELIAIVLRPENGVRSE